ncbi:MAG: hypothetical protein Q9175_004400 [Cornicularia normoerica]
MIDSDIVVYNFVDWFTGQGTQVPTAGLYVLGFAPRIRGQLGGEQSFKDQRQVRAYRTLVDEMMKVRWRTLSG